MGERGFNTIICGMVVSYYSAVTPHDFIFFLQLCLKLQRMHENVRHEKPCVKSSVFV